MNQNFVNRISPEWLADRCEEDGDCLVWKLATNGSSQPTYTFKVKGKSHGRQMRRIVWEMMNGPVDWAKGRKVVSMTCENPCCLNHEHMKLSTRRAVITKTARSPDVRRRVMVAAAAYRRSIAKITMDQAQYVRECGKTLKQVSGELGISIAWASKIRRGEAWRDLRASPFSGLL